MFCMLLNPRSAQAKLKLVANTFHFLVFSKDKKWKKEHDDPASFFPAITKDENHNDGNIGGDVVINKKTVIFLRHGKELLRP